VIITEQEFTIPAATFAGDQFDALTKAVSFHLHDGAIPIRFAITRSDNQHHRCEVAVIEGAGLSRPRSGSIFDFNHRLAPVSTDFNVALVVPTGIGADIGGHAGDASPVARLLAEACDLLITHPNVANASDINELPENSMYVEGSVICRLLMGTAGLYRARKNRVLLIIDDHKDEMFVSAAVNAVSAGRSSYGLECSVLRLKPPIEMSSQYSASGRAVGTVKGLAHLFQALESRREDFDAVAVSSVINVPHEYHQAYFDQRGDMVNPWGGVEAMLTHAVSAILDVPSAHAPMFESREIANTDPGVVEPRMAAEAISLTFLQSVLKGLHRAPRLVTTDDEMRLPGVLTARDISCLVIPEGCVGLPTLAALAQGIPVIAVKENHNLMQNDLLNLPWPEGQFFQVANYWEAAGVISALRAGIDPMSVRRPLAATRHTVYEAEGLDEVPATRRSS
jgi:CBS domain-containing protein